jgi:CRP-like cAMP-binding protein
MTGDHHESVVLATVGAGEVVGEGSFYLHGLRSASVTATQSLAAWRFSRTDLGRLGGERPEAAVAFHQAMAAMLSRRLAATNGLVRFLAD